MSAQDTVGGSSRQRHRTNELTDRRRHQVSVASKGTQETLVELRGHATPAFGNRVTRHLSQFMIGQQDMHSSGVREQKTGDLHEHSIAQVDAIDQLVTVDEFLKDEMIVGTPIKCRVTDHSGQVLGIVMKIASHQKASGSFDHRNGATTIRRLTHQSRRFREASDHRRGVSFIDGGDPRHLDTSPITSRMPEPVVVDTSTPALSRDVG